MKETIKSDDVSERMKMMGKKRKKKKKRIWKQTNKTGEKKTEEEVEEKRKGMNRLEEGRKKVSFSCKTAPYID